MTTALRLAPDTTRRIDIEPPDLQPWEYAWATGRIWERTTAPPVDVLINLAERSALSCAFPAQRSAQSSVDNCYRDQAVTNAAQLADLLRGADAAVVAGWSTISRQTATIRAETVGASIGGRRRPGVFGGVVRMDVRVPFFYWSWHWNDDHVMWATVAIAMLMLVAGIVFMATAGGSSNRFGLGASLVSGGFVTVAIFGLQLASNLPAKEESFQLGIAMQSDLSGFDPKGRSLPPSLRRPTSGRPSSRAPR